MNKPNVWSFRKLWSYDFGEAALWTLNVLCQAVTTVFPFPVFTENETPPPNLKTILVIGGGILMDRAKYWRAKNSPETKLFLIPSVWGSGAENSPIAILNEKNKKAIHIGSEYLPDVRSVWPDLANTIPDEVARFACGDVWVHALEGLLSPIGNENTKLELVDVIKAILKLKIEKDYAWYELSARACAGQAATSSGLVHGIAHTLEVPFQLKYPDYGIGHARLCSTYLWPVLNLNLQHTDKIDNLFSSYGIDKSHVIEIAKSLHEEELYHLTLPLLEEKWEKVLRDPSSRTNCILVRSGYFAYFKENKF